MDQQLGIGDPLYKNINHENFYHTLVMESFGDSKFIQMEMVWPNPLLYQYFWRWFKLSNKVNN